MLKTKYHSNRGATFIVCILLFALIAVVSRSGLETIMLQGKMANISVDRSSALNRAEATLRYAENLAEAQADANNSSFPKVAYVNDCGNLNQCLNGFCVTPGKACQNRWENPSFTGWQNVPTGEVPDTSGTPRFFVEFLGDNFSCDGTASGVTYCSRYRVTVHSGSGNSQKSQVVLQSIYASE